MIDFFMPVPLNSGCLVTVVLPKQYSVNTVKEVNTLSAFGAKQERSELGGTLRYDKAANSFTISACDSYVENKMAAVIEIDSLIQPNFEAATESLII